MPPFIAEISAAVAIAIAIGGALYALRRQGDVQTQTSDRDLQGQVTELKATNRFLVVEIARLERENERSNSQNALLEEQLRDWRRRYESQTAENEALTRALAAGR